MSANTPDAVHRSRRRSYAIADRRASDVWIPSPRRPQDERGQAPQAVAPISVNALLRREGRAAHGVDRPLQPRGRHFRLPDPADSWAASPASRRAGAAACALVAAASVFGAAVLTDATGGRGGAGLVPFAPDPSPQQRPDGATDPLATLAISTLPGLSLLGQIVSTSDVGIGGPLAAFAPAGLEPTAGLPASPSLGPAALGPGLGGPGLGGGGPGLGGGGTGGGGPAPVGGVPGTGGGSSPSGPVETVVDGVTRPVSTLTGTVDTALPGPVGDAVDDVGALVQNTGAALGGTVDEVVEPLGDTVETVVEPLGDTVETVSKPLGDTVETVVEPLGDTVETVSKPLTSLLGGSSSDGDGERTSSKKSTHDGDGKESTNDGGGDGDKSDGGDKSEGGDRSDGGGDGGGDKSDGGGGGGGQGGGKLIGRLTAELID